MTLRNKLKGLLTFFCLLFIYSLKSQSTSWTWMSGSKTANVLTVYGTKGLAASTNNPGAREASITWRDAAGNLWLFGGYGYGSGSAAGFLNDLWKWDGVNWTWISGSNVINQSGVYGIKGIAASQNIPGGRHAGLGWADNEGNFWLFGGGGFDANGSQDRLNDVWKWDGSNWTWISGSNLAGQSGIYGSKGVAASSNMPGARLKTVGWKDASGNFWLFGGEGYAAGSAVIGYLNDLWKWDGTNWTWVNGSNSRNMLGTYGTKGVAASSNLPGPRGYACSWIDVAGNFWLFGGGGYTTNGNYGFMNDLWKWDGTNWTWMSGSSNVLQYANYGTKGVTSATNVPGARFSSMTWKNANGNLFLFGGQGYAESGSDDFLNDVWMWDGANWTWIDGAKVTGQFGSYGNKGVSSPTSFPGARSLGIVWQGDNNIWLMGGRGRGESVSGNLNDLWQFGSPITLPLKLIDFAATPRTGSVILAWITENERNVSNFEVQYSKDQSSFNTIGKTDAKNNRSNTYEFSLSGNLYQNGFYRLKVLDIDGSYFYSKTVSVTIRQASIKIIPNPVTTGRLLVVDNKIQGVKVSYCIYNSQGELIQNGQLSNQSQTIVLKPNLSKGIYLLKLENGDFASFVIQ